MRFLQKMVASLVVTGLALSASNVPAQNSSAANAAQPASVSAPAPQLSYGAAQVLRLARANVGEETIIAYIRSSANSYALDANQIIYLRQQGISDAVITTMLSQPNSPVAVAVPATPAPPPVATPSTPAPVVTVPVAPTVTYVQTVPAPNYYYAQPYYYPYYPSYGVYPGLSLSFAWGSGGGGWHGGGYHGEGGGYGGGGYHGGGYHGGGGWHH